MPSPTTLVPLLAVPALLLGPIGSALGQGETGNVPAHATGGGLALGEAVGTMAFTEEPEWIDGEGRVIRGGQCWTGGATPAPLRNLARGALAARPGSNELFVLQDDPAGAIVWSCSCDHDPVRLGQLTPELGLQLLRPLALGSDDSIWVMGRAGLYRVSTAPLVAAELTATTESLVATAGLPSGETWSVDVPGMTTLPDDRVLLLLRAQDPVTAGSAVAIVELSPELAPRRRFGPERRLTGAGGSMIYSASFGAALVDGLTLAVGVELSRPVLGVVTDDAPISFDDRSIPPWPFRPALIELGRRGDWRRMISGADGRAYVLVDDGQLHVVPLLHDPDYADFDRDGLLASEERALGTSDARADTDGDGFGDGSERTLHATSPTDAASRPRVEGMSGRVLAPSLLFREWSGLPDGDCMRPFPMSFGEPLCSAGPTSPGCINAPGDWVCVGPDRAPVTDPIPSLVHPRWSRDLHTVWRMEQEPSGTITWVARDVATSRDTRVALPFPGDTLGAIPISGDSALFADLGSIRLWRADGSGAFPLIDATRATCPIVSGPEELARCGAPELSSPTITGLRPIGFDDARERVVVLVSTKQSEHLLEIGERDLVFAGDVTGLSGNARFWSLLPLASGGYVATANTTANVSYRLDSALRPVAVHQPALITELPIPPFGDAFHDVVFQGYLREPPFTGIEGGACSSGGVGDFAGGEEGSFQIFVCDAAPTRDFVTQTSVFPALWVEAPEEVEQGEVVIWSAARGGGSTSLGILERDGELGPQTRLGWFLWRVTRRGGVLEWMDEQAFTALLAEADRTVLSGTAPGPIHAMASNLDGTRLCLAEPTAERVWELRLDATTRRVISAHLASVEGGGACAYDDSGELAVARATAPASITTRAGTLSIPGAAGVNAMVRVPGGWVLAIEGGPMTCLGDGGELSTAGWDAAGLAPGLVDLVALVDARGYTALVRAEDACGPDRLRAERILLGTVWEELYNPFLTQRSVASPHASLALRPDGMALFAPRGVFFRENGAHDPTVSPDLVFYAFGALRPFITSTFRHDTLDPYRLTKDVFGLASREIQEPGAMTLVRGATAGGDWGYPARPGQPYMPRPDAGAPGGADAGTSSGGRDAGTAGAAGGPSCACSAEGRAAPSGAGPLLLLLLLASAGVLRDLRTASGPSPAGTAEGSA